MRSGILVLVVAAACASSAKDNSCVVESDCTDPALPYCVNGACVACDGPMACTPDAPRCYVETGTCGGCVGDLDCTLYPSALHCAPEGVCVGCLASSQCANPAPVCDAMTRECRICRTDDECASGVCDVDAGTCVAPTAIVYASPTGPDTANCTQASPCSLTHAIATADALKRTIRMLPGSYPTAATVSGSTKTFTIVGTGATLTGAAGTSALVIDQGANVTIRGLAIAPATSGGSPAVRCTAATGISTLALREMSVAAPNAASVTMQTTNCQLTLKRVVVPVTANSAITMNTGTTAYIDRSFLKDSIALSGTTIALSVTSSVFLGNINLGNLGGATNVRVSFSTFYNAAQACTASQLQPTIIFDNNIFVGGEFDADSIIGTKCSYTSNLAFPQATNLGLGTIRLDPKFVDPAAGDFHLQASSPAIDAADPAALTTVDYDGTPRPQGAHADLGAFEYK